VCMQFRDQALTKRSFASLVGHWRWSSARTKAVKQVVDRWVLAQHQTRVRQALGVWRLRGAKGALRRRGAKALGLFLTASRLRRWLNAWSSIVSQERRRSQGLATIESRKRIVLGSKSCKVWRHAARRSIAARSVAEFLQDFRVRNIIHRWASQWKADGYRSMRLRSAAWRGLQLESRRVKAGCAVQRRGYTYMLRSAWKRWSTANSLKNCDAICQQRAKMRRLVVTLRSWKNLKAAKVFAARSTLLHAFRIWSEIVGHLRSERGARELMVTAVSDGPSAWWQRCCERLQKRLFLLWGQVARGKRRHRRKITEAKEAVRKVEVTQALWFWHGHAREMAAREDHIHRASMALMAMVSASRWARAHDLLVRWFVRAKAKRIKCAEADLSDEVPSAISLKDGSGISEPTAVSTPRREGLRSPSRPPVSVSFSKPSPSASAPSRQAHASACLSNGQSLGRGAGEALRGQDAPVEDARRLPASPVLSRWLKLVMSLWLTDAAALSVLRWACSAWRGVHLQVKLYHLRWWAFVLKTRKLRKHDIKRDLKRLRATFKAWFEAVAEQLQEAVAVAEAELLAFRALSDAPEETSIPFAEPVTMAAMFEPLHCILRSLRDAMHKQARNDRCFVGGRGAEVSPSPRLRGPGLTNTAGAPSGSSRQFWCLVPASAAAVSGLAALRAQRKPAARRSQIIRRADGLADCPYALYGPKDVDIAKERQELQAPSGPMEIKMPDELKGDLEGQRKFFSSNLPQIYKDLKTHGAVVFRGFEISKDKETFGQVGKALELDPCEDPLHSVAARDAVDKKAGVYEAVNKP
ncbi:DGAT2, partial [Symbiodinium pilosum]